MDGSFGNDVGVEAVAEIDRIDVVTVYICQRMFAPSGLIRPLRWMQPYEPGLLGLYIPFEIAVHNGEEDLEKEVNGVYQHRYEVQPCFSRHHEGVLVGLRASVFGGTFAGRVTLSSGRLLSADKGRVWCEETQRNRD